MSTGLLVNQKNNDLLTARGFNENDWVFIMCENCYWSASLSTSGINIDLSKCPFCKCERPLAIVPIASNEEFTFSYSEKHGVELDFMPRKAA
jgi:hypothetical protein